MKSSFSKSQLQEAQQYCSRLATSHYENFPVGRWVSPSLVPHMHVLYAFSRMADDFADEKQYQGSRLEQLASWREKLYSAAQGKADHPVFIALTHTLSEYQLPIEWLDHLIMAFEQDVRQSRHKDFASLVSYAKFSANPVGRLVLWLHGYRDEKFFELSDSICSALQFANFWQDISIDLAKDRIYLPQEEMFAVGYTESDLQKGLVNSAFQTLLKKEIHRTREWFIQGRPLCDLVSGKLKFELRLVWSGGMRILEKIEEVEFDVFRHRPSLRTWDKGIMLWRALGWRKSEVSKP